MVVALLGLALAFSGGSRARAQGTPAPGALPEDADCLSCHADRSLAKTFGDGQTRSLFVDAEALRGSAHGAKLRCRDCHPDLARLPHARRPHASLAEFRASFRDACRTCHLANYSRFLDSVHSALAARGDAHAPGCVGCHGAHDVGPPARPRSRVSATCATCHEGVARTYARSVHGKALLDEHNGDVPVCTDCHRSHAVAGPGDASWLLQTPELCGRCHTDEPLMKKYGLSTAVLRTYLADFHGKTASLARTAEGRDGPVTALCVDCHGVHDIVKVKEKDSPVLRSNLVRTCRRCHPEAGENFPAAWLSHYEPSWSRAPLVYAARVFYVVFIPFVVGGLVLQILLHLWRVVVNR